MKVQATLAVLAAVLAAASSACSADAGTAPPPQGSTAKPAPAVGLSVDDILERNLAALGGKEKLRALKSLRFEATEQTGTQSVPLLVYWKRPDRLRVEAPEEGLLKIQAFDGTRAWSTYPELPGFEAQFLDGAEQDALRDQADLVEGPTFDYVAKGNRVELLGKESLNNRDAWRLELTTARGEVRMLWFDCASFLEVREERVQTSGDRRITTDSMLSDFRPAGGVLFAHRVESRSRISGGGVPERAGEPSVFTIQKLEVDVDLPDSLFALPPAAAPAASAPAPSQP